MVSQPERAILVPGMWKHLNHRQLEAFRAVFESGTVTAAAERMFITQPAVTRLLQDLESTVGFALFDRTKGRLAPTVEGELLFEEVERSFSGLEKIAQAAEDIRTLNRGMLRIAAMPAIALRFLPRVIQKLTEAYPRVTVSLQIRSSTKVMEWIASQQFDVGIAAVQQPHPAVVQETLCVTHLVAGLPPGHRYARRRVLRPKDFEGEAFVSLGPELNMRGRIDEAFARAGVIRQQVLEAQLSAAICELVIVGAGLALVDPITAHEMHDRGLVAKRFEPKIDYPLSLLFPSYRSRAATLEAFLEILRRELAENPWIA